MSKLICLQSGHENIKSNCDVVLRSSTGAPGELEFTVRIRNRLSQILQDKGFQVQLVDANFNCNAERTKDFDLFLAIHYDANVYGTGGGFVDYPDPSVDAVNSESKRIKEAIESEYFNHSGVVNHPERSNINTKFYYMWRALSSATPCVIIEAGVGQDPHDKVILADTNRVCNSIARGVCRAFSVSFDPIVPPAPPVDPCAAQNQQIKDLTAQMATANNNLKMSMDNNKILIDKITKAKEALG